LFAKHVAILNLSPAPGIREPSMWCRAEIAGKSSCLRVAGYQTSGKGKAKRYLSATVEHLHEGLTVPAVADLKLTITWSVAVDTDVARAIIRLAENGEDTEGAGVFGGCDVIAMATHGYSGLQRWAMGSITQRVLSATTLPLLVVRPPDMMDKSYIHWDQTTIATFQG
jgi:nucleotide-binding universal stress UspA family protein